MSEQNTLVIGTGEIGQPLADILSLVYPVQTLDVEPKEIVEPVHWMHICFPYSDIFIGDVINYINQFNPLYTVIHSTVEPGTTINIQTQVETPVIYSSVRGRHEFMHRDMMRYIKFVASNRLEALNAAIDYFSTAHFSVGIMSDTTTLEFAKLVSTSYTALLIGWAQELERFSRELMIDREEVLEFTRDTPHLPRHIFHPGHIGGHCLMQNIDLLLNVRDSELLKAIQSSNEQAKEWDNGMRYSSREL